MTKEGFTKPMTGASGSYSNYCLCNTNMDDVIKMLELFGYSDENVINGYEQDGAVYFTLWGELPDMIYSFTTRLQTHGYADIDWERTYTICADKGTDSDDFTAEWVDENAPVLREWDGWSKDDEDAEYDAFITITDNKTGAIFSTGAGAISGHILEEYRKMVENHRRCA